MSFVWSLIAGPLGYILAGLAAWGMWVGSLALERRKAAELQRQNDRIDDADTAARIGAARADAAGAAGDDVDRLLADQAAEAHRLRVVPGTARNRGRGEPR